jgi:hypothetical protein
MKRFSSIEVEFFRSDDEFLLVSNLEGKKSNILQIEEETWCQKSRLSGCLVGTKTQNFFHKLVDGRKRLNTIWDIVGSEGIKFYGQRILEKEVAIHFKALFNDQDNLSIVKQMEVIQTYPIFFYC